jgi:DNA-directed RNA polymerase sigma subunit (sigma70/sigma32)
MENQPTPTPTLEEVARAFERTRDRIRELEERARRELPDKPPGDDDPGTAPPAMPPRR